MIIASWRRIWFESNQAQKYSSSTIWNDVKFFFRAILFQEYNRKSIELLKAKGVSTFSNNTKLHNIQDVHIK